MSTDNSKENRVVTDPSELMTPEAGAKATTMEEDFSELKGEEIATLRGVSRKVFDLGKGRHQAISYSEPVHYIKSGRYEDIDNRLEYNEKEGVLETRANAYRTQLAKKDEGKALVTLRREGRAFSFTYIGAANGAEAEITEIRKQEHANEEEARADLSETLHSRVKYSELRPGMDVEICINGKGLEDRLILKTEESKEYAAVKLPEGYTYKLQDNGDVQVYLDGKEYITVSAPFAYDAEGKEVGVKSVLTGNELRYELEDDIGTVYPIVIDPVIEYNGQAGGMYTVYIDSTHPNTNYRTDYLNAGVYTTMSGPPECVTLVKPDTLVPQKSSDTIIGANLNLKVQAYGGNEWYLGAYRVTSDWNESTVTWNNMDASHATHMSNDLQSYISNIATGSYGALDITEAYRSWYKKDSQGNHTNYGIAVRRACAATFNCAQFYSSRYADGGNPYISVNYVSHAGRKSWWKYEGMETGRAGSVYVDIYNGNSIAEHVDTVTAGNRMPVSISHIYNSCLSDEDEAYCGLGWRMSVNQYVRRAIIMSQRYYIWKDGDGTEHYFEVNGDGPYSDCEGMQLKLSLTSNWVLIKDKSDTQMRFPLMTGYEKVYLDGIQDAQGNTMFLTYDANYPGRVTKVKDGINRETVLSYGSNGLLSSITAPGCPVVSFTYGGNSTTGYILTRISYSDLSSNQYTEYSYDTYGGQQFTATLVKIKNYDGIETRIGYDTDLDTTYIGNYTEQTRHVVSLERVNGNVKGTKKLLTYGHMHTVIKYVSGTASDEDGKSITYHFNNAGNVVSAHDEEWHGLAVKYNSGIDNTPGEASDLVKTVINRIEYPDFFKGWTLVKGHSSDACARNTGTRCMSLPVAKLVKGGAGELKLSATGQLYKSGTYTFSGYVNTTGITVPSGKKGTFLRVISNGNTYESRAVYESTSGKSNGTFASGWERMSVTFPFEYGTDTSVTVVFVCDGSAGTLYWGCPQLEEGTLAGSYNMVADGDFSLTVTNTEGSSPRLFPKMWSDISASTSMNNGVVTDRTVNLMPEGVSGNAMRLTCLPSTSVAGVYAVQNVRAYGYPGDVFTVRAWCNAKSIAKGYSTFKPRIGVRFLIGSNYQYSSWKYMNFDTSRSGWHCATASLAATQDYFGMQIGVFYGKNANTAMYSHISMSRELYGNVYDYDTNGNVLSIKDLSNQQSAATYDSFHNLLSYVQPGSGTNDKYLFTYGSTDAEKKKHLPRTATTPEGVKTTTTYDSYGNALTSTIQENSSSPLIKTETEYTSDGNYVVKQKDARGNEVTNTLDANGKVLSVKDPANQEVEYTYDSSNRVTKVETEYTQGGATRVSKNEYTYENDRIKTVAHNTASDNASDVRYTFNYDALGRKTSVSVSNGSSGATEQVLSTNVYSSDRKSLLNEVQYGNGGKVKYTYDEYDRVTGITHDSDTDPKYRIDYDSRGRAARVTDAEGGSVTNSWDTTQRPVESEQRDGNDALKYRNLIEYDNKSRVSKFHEVTGSGTHKTEYQYDKDNRVKALRYDGSNNYLVNYTFDKLNRITGRKITNSVEYNTQYGYVQGNTAYGTNATTPLVASITQGSGANAFNLAYTYDSRGNITSETRNGNITTYEYDALGQLVRVNDKNDTTGGSTGTTWIYTYDRGGNILSKSAYAYTTEEVGTAVRTYTYGYTDTNWKDKLTSFDNSTITYDAIGNPLSDGTWTYVWQAGRQLRSMTKADGNDTITVEFEYDHAGLRTKKTRKVNNVINEVTEYILNGKNVVELIHTAYPENSDPVVNVLHFYYDAQGRPAMVKYNGVMYGYVHDLQGDVIGILDNTGSVAVEYKYDAWGRPLGVTGTLAATLGELNPFRYRGYVFDQETQLYYLRSRYYQPFVSRFMNLDKRIIPKKRPFCLSLQCYCNNRPVQCIDSEGTECSESFPSGCATSFEIYRLDTYEMAAFALWLFNGYNSNTQESPTSKAARNTANNLINIFLASNMITSVCKMAYDLVYGIIEPYSSNKDEQILEFGGLLGLTALALDVQTIESFEVICFFGHYGSEIGVMIETGYGDYLVGPIQIGDPALREIDNILSSYYEYEHGYPRGPITLSEFYASRE